MCLYFSEAVSSSGVSHDKPNHRFALTARPSTSLGVRLLGAIEPKTRNFGPAC
jgi:hypothetical protein